MSDILKDFSEAASAVVENVARRVVAINGRDWGGSSGIIVKPGVVVTAEEALERDDEVEVILPNGHAAKASVAGRDPSTDVAVLRVNGAAELRRPKGIEGMSWKLGWWEEPAPAAKEAKAKTFREYGKTSPANWISRVGGSC